MHTYRSLIFIFFFILSCTEDTNKEFPNNEIKVVSSSKQDNTADSSKSKLEFDSVFKDFHNYLNEHLMSPDTTILRKGDGNSVFRIGDHTFEWPNNKELIFYVNDKSIDLTGSKTLNNVWGYDKDSIFSNFWEEVSLYEFENTELLGVNMGYFPCNGLGCSVSNFVLYDVDKNSWSLFASLRIDNKLKLYSFEDDKVSFLATTHIGHPYRDENVRQIYTRYDHTVEGDFKIQKIKDSIEKITLYLTDGDTIQGNDSIQSNWFEKLDF